ncbi:TPA: hypothetical protein ACNTJT_002101, partial [Neisseria meningitidis]
GFIRQDGFLPQRKIADLPVKSAVCPGAAGALGFRRHIFRNGGILAVGAAAVWGREGILWSVTAKNMPHHCWCWVAWCSVWAV